MLYIYTHNNEPNEIYTRHMTTMPGCNWIWLDFYNNNEQV